MASIAKFDEWQNTSGTRIGTVLQVVQTSNTTQTVVTSDGAVDIGLSASITVRGGSKVLIMGHIPIYAPGDGGTWTSTQGYIYEGGTWLCNTEHLGTVTAEAQCYDIKPVFFTEAKTAGTYTYNLKIARVISGTRYVKRDNRVGSIILMEIQA